MDLRNALSQTFQLELPATITFDHPTPDAIVSYIAGKTFVNASTTDPGHVSRPRNKAVHSKMKPLPVQQPIHADTADVQLIVSNLVREVLGAAAIDGHQPLMEVSSDMIRPSLRHNLLSGVVQISVGWIGLFRFCRTPKRINS